MDLTVVTRMGDTELHLKGITLKELLQLKTWGGGRWANKAEWREALGVDDPEALQAAYALAVWRDAKEKDPEARPPKLADLDFDTDDMSTFMVDGATGRKVGIDFETNDDGTLKMEGPKDGPKRPVPKREKNGTIRFVYLDDDGMPTDEAVPPTETS